MDTQTIGLTQSAKKKTKVIPPHYDKLGVEVFPGDYVATPGGHRELKIAKVVKLNPKMLTVAPIGDRWNTSVYARESIKLDPALVTMYILRNEKK